MNELDKLIKKSDYKLEAFENELNISRGTFWRIRKGTRPLRENEINKLSKMLDISEKDLKEVSKFVGDN
ncbi:helix-turn-helix domain-containing protein [Clostridium perfringens]|uniref:helix-turn-helix domain-containing protein n=1 Tax=Clostridium perfringens TaxID=1502 RepID=UPI000E0AB85A|nr:helix-turn-helix domain-containing protein [Clostridium perfringens]AXH51914.1 hypothetical protein C8114_04610 [Clostridium perfringens]MBI6029899.1 helix-turn-helix transcriptional regulator [Clostridium perfringens]MBI6032621.1 helix-turn-helix transcriptional regulator [Clostridium perfringens]UUR87698.1 helix-turn-helix transcriptional regulator [Clostridium perfringens]